MKKDVTNWGNFPIVSADVLEPIIQKEVNTFLKPADKTTIARGMGRCYGDSSLGANIAQMTRLNKYHAFNEETGELTCDAGVTLSEIIETFLTRGWFLPVTPGTKFVTVGGAIASDVHGKNHHMEGSFSNHIINMELILEKGKKVTCSKTQNPDLFEASCGGMGLTGIIVTATFRLKKIESAYIRQESLQAPDLDSLMEDIEDSRDWTYSVAWIDCLATGSNKGRGILMRGEHAIKDDLDGSKHLEKPFFVQQKGKLAVPFNFPEFALNQYSVKAFNTVFYNKQQTPVVKNIVDYDKFFYPLDNIHNWNKMYGSRGFTQYQCAFPPETSRDGISEILDKVADEGRGSFLAVLKQFGEQEGILNFPSKGYTLTLDFPLTDGIFTFLDELDKTVLKFKGKLYLTKDVRMSATMFEETYPNKSRFEEIVRKYNPGTPFVSRQSERLGLLK